MDAQLCKAGEGTWTIPLSSHSQSRSSIFYLPCAVSELLLRSLGEVSALAPFKHPMPQPPTLEPTFASVTVASFKTLLQNHNNAHRALLSFLPLLLEKIHWTTESFLSRVLSSCNLLLVAMCRSHWKCNSINQPRIWPIHFLKYSSVFSDSGYHIPGIPRPGIQHAEELEPVEYHKVLQGRAPPQLNPTVSLYQKSVCGAWLVGKIKMHLLFLSCNKLIYVYTTP